MLIADTRGVARNLIWVGIYDDDDDDDDERMNFNVAFVLRLQGHVTRVKETKQPHKKNLR